MVSLRLETTFLEAGWEYIAGISAAIRQSKGIHGMAERNKCVLKEQVIQEPGSEKDIPVCLGRSAGVRTLLLFRKRT
jgi:hypothetical protein